MNVAMKDHWPREICKYSTENTVVLQNLKFVISQINVFLNRHKNGYCYRIVQFSDVMMYIK